MLNLVECSKIEEAANVVLSMDKRNADLLDQAQSINLQIDVMKPPVIHKKHLRFQLPYSLVEDTADICLLVPDLEKGKNNPHEPTIEHYKQLLQKHGVSNIAEVISIRQMKVEFDQYELKQRLCNTYDYFLVDSRMCGHFTALLGSVFHKRRKVPIPVKLTAEDLKQEISVALSKTLLFFTKGATFNVKVGHTRQTASQIAENVAAVISELGKQFPGGYKNIRALYLRMFNSKSVPLYYNITNPNEIETPVVPPRRPKNAVPVEDELSTIPGARVTVMPDGEVIVKMNKDESEIGSDSEELENSENIESLNDVDGGNVKEGGKVLKRKVDTDAGDDDDGEKSDSGVEFAEQEYLSQWQLQQEEQETENKNETKQSTKRKKKTGKISTEEKKKNEASQPTKRKIKTGKKSAEDKPSKKPKLSLKKSKGAENLKSVKATKKGKST